LPNIGNPTFGVIIPKLRKLGAVMPKLEKLENGGLVSPRLEGDPSPS
jgi:hypothetical protein